MNNNLVHEQIKVQEEEEMSLKWSKQATLLLISEYNERLDKIESGKLRQNRAFKEISNELSKAGYMFTKDQCTGRIKTITGAYKLVKDHNSKSGNDKKSYVFEEELDELYKALPNIKPSYVLGTLHQEEVAQSYKETESKKKVKIRHGDSDSEGTFNESTPKVRKTQASTVISYLETVTKTIDERHRQEQAKNDERHKERIGIFRELIDTLKEKK
jgi:hypothetical protein